MKTTFLPLLLAVAATACQPAAPTTPPAAAGVNVPADVPAAAPVATAEQPLPTLFGPADTLTAPMRAVLRQHDLAKLWQSATPDRQTYPVLKGFFGPDHYRFELVFSDVRRDAHDPARYHVRGKCHYRKNVRPFSGSIIIRTVDELERGDFFLNGEGQNLPDTAAARTYTAVAQVRLREEESENSGTFEGKAVLDFYAVAAPEKVDYVTSAGMGLEPDRPARGAGLLLRGNRRNISTRQVKPFVVSNNVFAVSPEVYEDFEVGERGEEVNPKYARLGWNQDWENDEWWADSPKPVLL